MLVYVKDSYLIDFVRQINMIFYFLLVHISMTLFLQ